MFLERKLNRFVFNDIYSSLLQVYYPPFYNILNTEKRLNFWLYH